MLDMFARIAPSPGSVLQIKWTRLKYANHAIPKIIRKLM